jgi:predicted kinase
MNKPDNYKLTSEQHAAVLGEVLQESFAGLTPASKPRAIFTGGQPGSGKSKVAEQAMRDLGNNAVRSDADEMRPYHPDYSRLLKSGVKEAADLVHADAAQWASELRREAQRRRFNIIIDGTMRDPVAIATVAQSLRDDGYVVEGRVMAVNELVSTMHIHKRYEAQMEAQGVGRFATKEQHDRAFTALPMSLEALERNRSIDQLTIYNRDGAPIYANALQAGRWREIPAARQALEIERTRGMTKEEKQDLAQDWGGVVKQAKARGAPEAELRSLTTLAQGELAKAATHGRGQGRAYEKLFATPEQMRRQPSLIGKYASLTAMQEGTKRQTLEHVHSQLSKMTSNLAAVKEAQARAARAAANKKAKGKTAGETKKEPAPKPAKGKDNDYDR